MKQLPGVLMRSIFFGLIICAMAGCGGPQLDPDVMKATDLPSVQRKVVYLKISGTLRDSDGNPVVGAKVVARTLRGNWTDITTHFGSFRVESIFAEGDTIDFHFSPATEKTRPAKVNWTARLYDHDLPKGVSRVTLNFHEDKLGVIRLGSIEY